MNKLLVVFTIFSVGYIMNDIVKEAHMELIDKANAEVAGMDAYDLIYDYDFRNAVEDIVEDCEVDGDEIDC